MVLDWGPRLKVHTYLFVSIFDAMIQIEYRQAF